MEKPLFLGLTDDREHPTDQPAGRKQPFVLSESQRLTGMHVIGGPGSGKSKFLEHCIRQDLDERRGVGLIDWHGTLYDEVLTYCAALRLDRRIIPLNISSDHIIGFDPFAGSEQGEANTLANLAIAALTKAWGMLNTNDTPTLESVCRCIFHAIIESRLTIAETEHFLNYQDENMIRDYLASRIKNPAVQREWKEITQGSRRDWREEWRSSRSKLLRFVSARPLLRFMGLTESIDLQRIMDEGAVLLVNLRPAEGVLDEQDARVFGAMLVTKFFSTARRRIRRDGTDPRPFYLYCDEFQNFVSPDVPNVVAEGRKMGLSLILAHQYLGQLAVEDQRLIKAVMGAVRTRVVFGVEDPDDARVLVPSLFRGLVDFHEVKRITYSVKFWQQYDRDKAITEGESETEAEGEQYGAGHMSGFGGGGIAMAEGPTDQTTWMEGDSDFSGFSRSYAKTQSRSVADIPIYRQIPFLEGTEIPWSLEEQLHRLADALMLQLQQYCWVKPRDALAKPVVVPVVKPYRLPPQLVLDYETEQAEAAGAITPEKADQIRQERALQLEHQAQEFARSTGADVHSTPDHEPPSTRKPRRAAAGAGVHLNPAAPKKKPPQGTGGPEE